MSQKSFFILAPVITTNSLKVPDLVFGVFWETHSNSALGWNISENSQVKAEIQDFRPLYKVHAS